jgi:hypothetical protein
LPELPEVEAVRRSLAPFLTQTRIADVEVRRPDLRVPFPRRFRARLVNQTVLSLTRRAKYLMAALSSSETLLVHLGMSGSFRVDSESVDRHDHVVIHMASGVVVTFNDPRRFGLMTLLTQGAARAASRAQPTRPGAVVLGLRRSGAGASVPRAEDRAQGRAPRSAQRRRHRQHLRERGAASGAPVAVSARVDDGDGVGCAARGCRASD